MAGKCQMWDRLRWEDRNLEHLHARRRDGPVDEPAFVRDSHHARRVGLGDVIDADQPGELDRHAYLLAALPDRRHRWILVVVDETAGQAPETVAGLDRPATQDDSALGFHDHRGRNLRVMPQGESVAWAGLHLATFDDSRH
jgi:hypothetical protein